MSYREEGGRPQKVLATPATLCTVAVLGTGSIGMRHLEIFRGINGIHVVAVPTRPERIRQLEQDGYATAIHVDEVRHMDATCCVIATDTGRHVEDALAALERGMDVLVEKPMAKHAREAHQLYTRALALGRKVFVGCVLRFSESLNTFRELLPTIGALHAVRIECQSYLPAWRPTRSYRASYAARAEDGGVLRDLIHEIDYAGWLFGWPDAVHGRLRNLGRLGIEAEEIADLSWVTASECAVSISLDYLSKPSRRRMRACGEFGTLEWDGIEGAVTLARAEAAPSVTRSAQTRQEMFTAQARAFLSAIRGAHEPRLATDTDGLKALAVCDAARRSSETRREEPVESQWR